MLLAAFLALSYPGDLNRIVSLEPAPVLPQVSVRAWLRPGALQRVSELRKQRRLARAEAERREFYAARVREAQEAAGTGIQKAPPLPPRQVVTQTMVVQFQNARGVLLPGVEASFAVYDKADTKLSETTSKTNSAGKAEVVIRKFPARVSVNVDSPKWEISDPKSTVVKVYGQEGRVAMSPYAGYLVSRDLRPEFFSQKKPTQKKPAQKKPGQKTPTQKIINIRKRYEVPAPIVLRNKLVTTTFKTKPGATITIGDEVLGKTDASGTATIDIPSWKLNGSESVLALVEVQTPGGTLQSTAELPRAADQETMAVKVEDPVLVAFQSAQIASVTHKSGLLFGDVVQKALGKPKEEAFRDGIRGDGSVWWKYDEKGVWFKMRQLALDDRNKAFAVERIRLTAPTAGSLGGLSVGSKRDQIAELWGAGAPSMDAYPLGKVEFAHGGVQVHTNPDDVIDYIELRRPTDYLEKGIEFDNRPAVTKVFFAPIEGGWSSVPGAKGELTGWLKEIPNVQVVGSAEEADVTLKLNLEDLNEKTGEVVNNVPFEYEASGVLTGTLEGALIDDQTSERINARAAAKVSFKSEVANGAAILVALAVVLGLALKDNGAKLAAAGLIALIGAAALKKLPDIMSRAQTRTRYVILRNLAQSVAGSLARQALFEGRVKQIGRQDGTVTINAGSAVGIKEGMEFFLRNDNRPAGKAQFEGFRRDYHVARVVSTTADEAVCKVFRVTYRVDDKARETSKEEEDKSIAANLLEPSTGQTYADILFRIPEPK